MKDDKTTDPPEPGPNSRTELLLYQSKDGNTRIDVRLTGETLWLTQNQMAELFQVDKSGISRHLDNIYETGELAMEATVAKFATVQHEGNRQVSRDLEHYNLDAIISVGYRVNSLRGTQFRIWATQRLREYLVKGFVLDDDRLKAAGALGSSYFDELLERIRDIRASELLHRSGNWSSRQTSCPRGQRQARNEIKGLWRNKRSPPGLYNTADPARRRSRTWSSGTSRPTQRETS